MTLGFSTSEAPENGGLPDGWTTVRVENILGLQNGFPFKPGQWSSTGRPIIRIQNLNSRKAKFNHFSGDLPSRFSVRKGDLLFAWSGTPGTSFGAHIWQGEDAWLNQHIFRVSFPPDIFDRDFLRLAINKNLQSYIEQAHGGAGLAHITRARFDDSELVVPPVTEQRRIATNVATLLKGVDAARNRILRGLEIARRFRRSLIADACSGGLTKTWRDRNLQANSPQWATRRLADIFDVATGATPLRTRASYFKNGDVPWVKSGAVNATVVTAADEFITQLALRETNAKIFPPGTLLVAMYGEGATRGKVAELGIAAATNQALAAITFNEDNESIRPFLKLILRNRYNQSREDSAGGVQPNLSLQMIRDIDLSLPSSAEQREIIRRVDSLTGISDVTETRIRNALAITDRLTRAILAKAFAGELVPTEAELARREGRDYEPASVLIERFRRERPVATKAVRSSPPRPRSD
jgi:type I restriction enzyme S subunit